MSWGENKFLYQWDLGCCCIDFSWLVLTLLTKKILFSNNLNLNLKFHSFLNTWVWLNLGFKKAKIIIKYLIRYYKLKYEHSSYSDFRSWNNSWLSTWWRCGNFIWRWNSYNDYILGSVMMRGHQHENLFNFGIVTVNLQYGFGWLDGNLLNNLWEQFSTV